MQAAEAMSFEGGWLYLLAAWLIGGLLTLLLEQLLKPAVRLRRHPAAWCLHIGSWTLLFSIGLLLTQRPGFAAAAGLASWLLVILVNNAKYRALQEPFLFSDFGLFSQALRHPRLYLPFLGAGPALTATAAIGLAVYLGLRIEPPLGGAAGAYGSLLPVAGGLLAGVGLLSVGRRLAPTPALLPTHDLRTLGPAASLWLYWMLERRQAPPGPDSSSLPATLAPRPDGDLPDIVAVQSESFFDVRRLWPGVRHECLSHYDRLRAEASRCGRLAVPAWGANTMRTEFGFLSGIGADAMGVHRFNPYRRLARHPVRSLASLLQSLGYRTVAIHPHPASFFERDKVYPGLGFDEFIDLSGFDRNDTCGPYICDRAVSRVVREILDGAAGPVFVFVITMENHGPLHLERVSPEDETRLYASPPPPGFDDLTVYLRHLLNADAMLAELRDTLSLRARAGVLCWFGDHVPSMPQVYAHTGHSDGSTDYLIWHSAGGGRARQDLAVDQLAATLLRVSGLPPGT